MNAKIQKISSEIEKTKAKISEFQARLKELEKQKTEFEDADIISAVRGSDITLADLAAILKKNRAANGGSATSGQFPARGGLLASKSQTPKNDENKEENDQ